MTTGPSRHSFSMGMIQRIAKSTTRSGVSARSRRRRIGHRQSLLDAGLGANDPLFRRFAVEMFVVGLRVGRGMVDDAVPMIRRRIDRIELRWNIAGIDDVVIDPSRDDYGEARSDRRPNAIEHRLTGSHLHA